MLLENFKMRLMEDESKNPALVGSKRNKPYVFVVVRGARLCASLVLMPAPVSVTKLAAAPSPLDVSC